MAGLLSALIPFIVVFPLSFGVLFAMPAIIMAFSLLTFHEKFARQANPPNN